MATAVALRSQPDRARWVTRIAIVIGGVGIVAGVAFGANSLYQAWRAPDTFDRTVIGGSLTVRLDGGQQAVVYDENGSTHALGDLALTITSPTGAAVPVEPYHGTLQYDRSDVVASAVGIFTATDAGSYQIDSAGAGSGTLAVGVDLADVAVDGLARGVQIAAVCLVAALALAVLATVSRASGTVPR